MNIHPLKFDSAISNRKIGKCLLPKSFKGVSSDSVLEFRKYDLVYLETELREDTSQFLKNFDWILADVKITLSQNIKKIIFDKVELTQNDFYNQKDTGRLLVLGKDLYKASRFYFDKNTRKLGRNIYQEWMKNSINRSLADEIIVCRDENSRVIGFVTVKINPSFVEPVLAKVDRNFAGKGYGKSLMSKCYNFILSKYPDIEVKAHTQLKNWITLRLHQSFGLKVSDYIFVYHIYPKGIMKI